MEMTKMIGALISSLQRSNGSSSNGNYPYNGKGSGRRNNYPDCDDINDLDDSIEED